MKSRLLITAARVQHALDDLKALKEEASHLANLAISKLLYEAEEELEAALRKIDSAENLL